MIKKIQLSILVLLTVFFGLNKMSAQKKEPM